MVREGFKQTEVGEVPTDWEVLDLGEIAEVKTGPFGSLLHEKDYVQDGTPIITVEHLGERGIEYHNLPMVSDHDRVRLKSYSLNLGDIVFSRVGSIDRNALVKTAEDGWLFSGRLLRVRVSGGSAISSYLSFHFHSTPFKQRVWAVAVGQTMPSLNTQILRGIKVILPLIQEQQAIAEALSDVDALIDGQEKLIAKKRDIKTATMQQLLTGKTRLPGFGEGKGYKQTEVGEIPEDWEVELTGSLCTITTGGRNTQDRIEEGHYPFFVRSSVVERINSYSFDGEAVLTAGDGVGTGKVFHYIIGKFDTHQRVYRMTNFKAALDGYYFYLYFSRNFYDRIMSMTAKSSVDSVRMEIISDMAIALPDILEQRAIAEVLSDMDKELEMLRYSLNKTKLIKQGMMQELLTGKTRLV